jgi:plastocyanin
VVNPIADPEAWRDGEEHFGEHCAVCHGGDGRGRSPIGSRMYPPVPDLASPQIQQFSDGALYSIIQHGVSWTGMPAFRSEHSPDDTWKLVSYIRRLPTLKRAEEPLHDRVGSDPHVTAITMDGTEFRPREVTVSAGDLVTWTNNDPFPHNVVSDAGGFHSGAIAPDASWELRPDKPGIYRYVCTLHPTMAAVLHVN